MKDYWKSMLDSLLYMYVNGSDENRAYVYEQLKQMAQEADDNNDSNLDLPFGEAFRASWEEWLDHQQSMGRKMPESTVRRQLKFLERFSEQEACEIIEQSIQNGWSGLFEPWTGA